MTYTYSWFTASGEQFDFTEDNGIRVRPGLTGVGAPPVDLFTEKQMSADGSALANVRRAEQRMIFPMHLAGDAGAAAIFETLARALFNGPGTVRSDNGTRIRERLDVIYEAGLEGNESRGTALVDLFRQVAVSLVALDPWWYGATSVVQLTLSGVNIPFDDASTGFDDMVSFDGLAASIVANSGDTVSYPVVTIRGPFTTALVRSGSTGRIELNVPLAIGDTVVVDARPGNRGPRLNGGPIDWALLTEDSRLFTIPQGGARVSSASTGEDVGDGSLIEVSARERYLTP